MAKYFVSFATKDKKFAVMVSEFLESLGISDYFFSANSHRGIKPGEKWETEIYQALDACEVLIPVITKYWHKSHWCSSELRYARHKSKTVIPLVVGNTEMPDSISDTQVFPWKSGKPEGLAALRKLLETSTVSPNRFSWARGRNPFPGLGAFKEEFAGVFYGRDEWISKFLQPMEGTHLSEQSTVISIVGHSGVGKSSIVRAGIIPHSKFLKSKWRWTEPLIPSRETAASISQKVWNSVTGNSDFSPTDNPDQDGASLAHMLGRNVAYKSTRVAIFIDQAEELFVSENSESLTAIKRFLSSLLNNSNQATLVCTIRDDSLSKLHNWTLSDRLRHQTAMLGKIPPWQLKDVIEGPALRSGYDVESGLVDRMLYDIPDDDALPLLAFCLNQMAEEPSPSLTLASYNAKGGIAGSLDQQAQKVVTWLVDNSADDIPAALEALKTIFIPYLVRWDAMSNSISRRRVAYSRFSKEQKPIVKRMVDSRILSISEQGRGEAEITVAHEAIFSAWSPLQNWISVESENLRELDDLSRNSERWNESVRAEREDSDRFLMVRATVLDQFKVLVEENPLYASFIGETEKNYIQASDAYIKERTVIAEPKGDQQFQESAELSWLEQPLTSGPIHEQLDEILDAINRPVALWDRENRLVSWNNKYRQICDSDADLETGMTHEKVLLLQTENIASSHEDEETSDEILVLNDGKSIRMKQRPISDGGFITVGIELNNDKAEINDLKRQQSRLRKLVAELERSEATSAELSRSLKAEKIRAEQSANARSAFLANMSHELRTPLNAINGFSEIIANELYGPLGDERYKSYATDILTSGQHMVEMIGEILDMAKIESGTLKVELRPIDITKPVSAALRLFRRSAKERNITLQFQSMPSLPRVEGDEHLIRQMVSNLVSNAIKFSHRGGSVNVSIDGREKEVRVAVRDYGIGIPSSDLARLGQPFEQAGNSRERNYEGTGLGLALTKSYAEMHGGRMTIASEEGRGTLVSFFLPVL